MLVKLTSGSILNLISSGKVLFYAETNADLTNLPCALPVVRLHGVTNTYPPQKKSFMMLRHMDKEFGDKFRWFMRAGKQIQGIFWAVVLNWDATEAHYSVP